MREIEILVVFLVIFCISAFLNLLLHTTAKKDWIISLGLSMLVTIMSIALTAH